jgi:hypothetical protein
MGRTGRMTMVLVGGSLMVAAAAGAATLSVGPAGSGYPYTDIQEAIDAASPGDTIEVYPGTYRPVHISKPISVVSTEGSQNTAIDGSGSAASCVFIQDADFVTLRGFTLRGGSGTEQTPDWTATPRKWAAGCTPRIAEGACASA